jgi:hypothetical protein
MPATLTPDQKAMRRFHEAVRSLQRMSGRDFEHVIKNEMGVVLSQTVSNMKKATVQGIEKNHRSQPGAYYRIEYAGPVSKTGRSYTPSEIARAKRRAAEARSRGKNGAALYYLPGSDQSHRHPSWLWSEIQNRRIVSLANKKAARGLAARMWVHIGQRLNISVKAPAYVRNARHHKKGSMAGAVITREVGKGKKYELGFINALTHTNGFAGKGAKGKSAPLGYTFRQALNKRANFFSQSIKLQAKSIIRKTLDRYPGLASVS